MTWLLHPISVPCWLVILGGIALTMAVIGFAFVVWFTWFMGRMRRELEHN